MKKAFDRIRRGFRLDLGRGRAGDEVDEEIRFHLEQRIAALMAAGYSRDRAEAEAIARFGPIEEGRDQLRASARARDEVLSMHDRIDQLRTDLRYALRQLVRAPGLSAAVALTFALGIGVNATIFTVVDRLLLRPPPYVVHPEAIVHLAAGEEGRSFGQETMNYPVFEAVRDYARGLHDVSATFGASLSVGQGESAQSAQALLVSGNYFRMLGVRAAIGRVFGAPEDAEPSGQPVVVLSHAYWSSHLAGDERALGTALDLAGRRFTIIGVMPAGFAGMDVIGPDLWIPMSAGAAPLMGSRWATSGGGSWLQILARRDTLVAATAAAADAMRVARAAAPSAWFTGRGWSFAAVPALSLRGEGSGLPLSVARLLVLLSAIVLLVACANVANLLLARGLRRREEIAVRLALGVSRGRLVWHLLSESAALAVLGGALALLVAYWGGALVFNLLFADLSLHTSTIDARVVIFTLVVTMGTGLATGLIPAWQASRPDPGSVLRSGQRDTGHRSRTRSSLMVGQASMAVVLLFAAGLFVRSLTRLSDVRMGVDVDRVALGSMNLRAVGRDPSQADELFSQMLERVRRLPGVSRAAVAATAPFGQSWGTDIVLRGRDSVVHADAMYNIVTPDYLKTLGARLLGGRDFSEADADHAPRVMIVNEMWATRYFGKESPIGRCVTVETDSLPCAEIVGIVENVRRQSIFEDSTGFVYFPLAQARRTLTPRELLVRIDGDNPGRLVRAVQQVMQTTAPGLPYADVHLLADEPTVRLGFRPYRLGATLFGAFGALALALAAIGMYGVVSYSVGQRTREMGVRIALGATRHQVAGLVVGQGVSMVVVGVVLGSAVALAGGRLVRSLLYDESARDPFVLAAVAVILVGTGVLASLVPAWRAVNTDPVSALRSD